MWTEIIGGGGRIYDFGEFLLVFSSVFLFLPPSTFFCAFKARAIFWSAMKKCTITMTTKNE